MLRLATAAAALVAKGAALEDPSAEFYAASEQAGRGVDNATMTGVLLSTAAKEKGAVCLDGSPGAYYHVPGTGSGKNKWYVHHQGGGAYLSLFPLVHLSTHHAPLAHQNSLSLLVHPNTRPEGKPVLPS